MQINYQIERCEMNAIDYLLNVVKRNSTREFIIDSHSGDCLTYGKLLELASAVAQDFFRRGLKKGNRVAILLENSISTAVLYFGCLYSGVVTVPINPTFTSEDIDFIIGHSGATFLVVSEDTFSKINISRLKELGIKILQVGNKKNIKGSKCFTELWDIFNLPFDPKFLPFKDVQPDDTLTIIYTSGTTAKPKGVVHWISALTHNARAFIRELGLDESNRFYGILSMTYLGGYYNLLLLPYIAGASVVLSKTFDAQLALDFWRPAIKYDVNTLWLVPSIISILMKVDRGKEGEIFCREKVRCALVGTAPLPVKLRQDFEERYGVILYENYGLSETLFITTNSSRAPLEDGSVGKVLPGLQVTILNDKGLAVAYGQEGEICVRTPYLMKGYYNSDIKSPELLDYDTYFATGDIGILSNNGDLFITGRKKNLIIRGGVNISPAAIENVLYGYPAIEEALVVGIPHEIYGEDIVAVVRLKEGHRFDETIIKSIKEYCCERLGTARKIGYMLEIDKFPIGPTGKILNRQVQEMVMKKLKLSPVAFNRPRSVKNSVGRQSMISGRICLNISRPNPGSIERIKKYSSSIISDCLNRLRVMDSCIKPIVKDRSFAGCAFTVEEAEGSNLMSHIALEIIQPGDVLVIDAKGITTRSCWGGLQTHSAKLRKVAGIVVFGMVRDYEEIIKCGIPVYAIGVSSAGPLKDWGGFINHPISCGGIPVLPGDVIVGDDDGIVVVPSRFVEEIIVYCEERVKMEEQWFRDVAKGVSTLDILGLREKVKKFGIKFMKEI